MNRVIYWFYGLFSILWEVYGGATFAITANRSGLTDWTHLVIIRVVLIVTCHLCGITKVRTHSVVHKSLSWFRVVLFSFPIRPHVSHLYTYWTHRVSTGTPISRLPIMAKRVLDLYTLYKLVVQRGGIVAVITKKLWQEIIRGLGLPPSITSAAFTLRTQ